MARNVPSGRGVFRDLVESGSMAEYKVEWRTYRDEDEGIVGIAIRIHDGLNRPMWIWGRDGLQRYNPIPELRNYLVQSIQDERLSDGKIARELCRLQAAGLITMQDRVNMQVDLMYEADAIEDAWAGR